MPDQILLPPAEDGNGNRIPSAVASFFQTGTSTPVTMYAADGTTPLGTTLTADGNGVFVQPFTNSGTGIKLDVKTPLGASLPGYPQDPAIRTPTTNSAAATVSFAPTIPLPQTNVQAAIEAAEAAIQPKITASLLTGRGWTYSTSQATTSGTAIDFTGIPSWVTEIAILLNGVSLSGTDDFRLQIGSLSGGVEVTGYSSASSQIEASSLTSADYSASFGIPSGSAGAVTTGTISLTRYSAATNQWNCSYVLRRGTGVLSIGAGVKTLSDVLDRVRLTRSGTNTFDAGAMNIGWR